MAKAYPIFVAFSWMACLLTGCHSNLPTVALTPLRQVKPAYQPLPPVMNASSGIEFEEMGARAGLHYQWTIAGKSPHTIRQTMGNGCAFLDYDNDGNLDILFVGAKLALYKGDGKGHFTDVTHVTGLDQLHGQFQGCAVGDYDNDGYDDLYITGYRAGVLLHNASGRSFKDVTKSMGLQPQLWGTSCAFVDIDGDGYLDLFVANYVQFDASDTPFCAQNGVAAACSPNHYRPLHDQLYLNHSGQKFQEVTQAWNALTSGNSLGVACADFDGSGRMGIAVANDERDGDLFRRQTTAHLININVASGTGVDRFGRRHAGMGIDWGDYDNDGLPDLFVTTFAHQDKCLYHNLGAGGFEEQSVETGVASALEPYVSFGCKFADFDNDGWLDLLVASGHVDDNIAQINKAETYRQPLELLRNTAHLPVRFQRVTRSAHLSQLGSLVGRGLATGDFDNDGRMDALVVNSEGAPCLLHNITQVPSHWIGFSLRGSGRSCHDAYGARVTVEIGTRRMTRECHADGSYLSSSDKRLHFGLGADAHVSRVSIRWPDGRLETRTHLAEGRYHTLTEGIVTP